MIKKRIGSHTIEVSSPDRLLFPADKITKLELVEYYEAVARTMVPHMRDRPISMERFPNGIDAPGFYQKQAPGYFPDWIQRVQVLVEGEGIEQPQVMVNDAASLVFVAEQDCITLHTWLSRQDQLDHPDRLIFDLDPPDEDFEVVRSAAQSMRRIVEDLGLRPFLMTTGSRGLHVAVPIERTINFQQARAFAKRVARVLAAQDPERYTTTVSKARRGKRLFVDYMRNTYAQHGVAPYSVRARRGAPVATPIAWEELADKRLDSQTYHLRNVLQRIENVGDPWKGMHRYARSVDQAEARLEEMAPSRRRIKQPS